LPLLEPSEPSNWRINALSYFSPSSSDAVCIPTVERTQKKKKERDDTVIFVILIKKIVAKPYCKSMTKRNLQYKITGNI